MRKPHEKKARKKWLKSEIKTQIKKWKTRVNSEQNFPTLSRSFIAACANLHLTLKTTTGGKTGKCGGVGK